MEDISILKENLERIAAEVHNAWWEEKKLQGFHAPNNCSTINTTSKVRPSKFIKNCDKCHSDMYPYEELPESIKEYDRVAVRAVISACEKI